MKRVLTLLVTIALSALTLPPASTRAQGQPAENKGKIVNSYREGQGGGRPAWVESAFRRSIAHLNRRGRAVGLLNAAAELALAGAEQDDLGLTHVRLNQVHQGVPVFGGQLVTHVNADSVRDFVSGRVYESARQVDTAPALSGAQAVEAAKSALGYAGEFARQPEARLFVLPNRVRDPRAESGSTLVYLVELLIEDGTEKTARHFFFVEANNGSVVWHYDNLQHQISTGWGYSLYSGTVSFRTYRLYTAYYLQDNTKCVSCPYQPSWTSDMRNATGTGNGNYFIDADNVWGNGSTSNPQTAGVDAHFGMSKTWDYYYLVHGRRGIDGNGFQMISRTHYGVAYNNAFWDGLRVTYGDGDGSVFRPLVSVDICGHEWTHGLTEKSAGLIYSGESGGSNESFSDIFGAAIEFYVGINPDYAIGEDAYTPFTPGDALRYMNNPRADGQSIDHYSQYFPGIDVHFSSGIQNITFYLLAEGGTHPTSGIFVNAIGRADAERIFFRALTVYLFPSASFHDVRVATLNAAADLYGVGSPQYNETARAWDAAGVF